MGDSLSYLDNLLSILILVKLDFRVPHFKLRTSYWIQILSPQTSRLLPIFALLGRG